MSIIIAEFELLSIILILIIFHKMATSLNMTLAGFLDFKELNDFSFEDTEE